MATHKHALMVFDLDGTLIDSLPDLAASANRIAEKFQLPSISTHDVKSFIGDGVKILVERLLQHYGDLAKHIHLDQAVKAYMDDYNQHVTDLTRPFPDTEETLAALKVEGWKLAVCTNKPTEAARAILDSLGLASFFQTIAGGDRFSARKPHPLHLIKTIEISGGTPSQSVMVGDHFNDLYAARDASIAGSIYARWGYGRPEMEKEATLCADSIKDVITLGRKIIEGSS